MSSYKEKGFDSVFNYVGGHGRYQWMLLFIVSLQMMLLTLHHLGFVFLGAVPEHWCYNEALVDAGWSPEQIRNFSSPIVSKPGENPRWSTCEYYDFDYEAFNQTQMTYQDAIKLRDDNGFEIGPPKECYKWFYDKSLYESTTVSQFNLVCQYRPLVATIQSTYMAGILCGSLVLATLSDKVFGRRKVTLFSICLVIISGIGASFAPNYITFVALRFFLAFGVAGCYQNCYVLLIEYSDAKSRTMSGIFEQLPFAVGYMLIPLFAYFLRSWSQLQLAFTLSGCLLLSYIWILPESARWLASRGRTDEAFRILEKVARINKKPRLDRQTIDRILESCQDEDLAHAKPSGFVAHVQAALHNFWYLVKTPKLRGRSLALWSLFFLVTTVYYGLSFGSVRLSENPFIVVFLGGLLEVPAYTVIVVFIKKFGRKPVIIAAFGLTGSVLLALAFTPTEMHTLQILFALAGKLFISSAFAVVYLLGAELYPTAMRTTGLGAAVIIGRFGSMTAPYLVDIMGTYGSGITLPISLFAAGSFVAAAVGLTLPETKSIELPDNVRDVETEAERL